MCKMYQINSSKCNLQIIAMILVLVFFYVIGNDKEKDVIYILLWTSIDREPFTLFEGRAKEIFFNRQCAYQNCFFTNDTSHFADVTFYDVIIFDVVNIQGGKSENTMPSQRSNKQLYIFFSIEPPDIYPLSTDFNEYFNYTWTYRFDSNLTFSYIRVTTNKDVVIGPGKNIHWMDIDNMKPTSKYVKRKLRHKTIAAAWFVSNCFQAKSNRLEFGENLKAELAKLGRQLDIYGDCGDLKCLKLKDECNALIEFDYYFYLAFENSFCEDYVSEKVLLALEHFAIPVVYGGANYTRYLAPGMYLNAHKLGPTKLAQEIDEIIKDKARYYEFFKWHRYYKFHGPIENAFTDEICGFCAFLNNVIKTNATNVFPNIARWWNGKDIVPNKIKKVVTQTTNAVEEDQGLLDLGSKILNYYFDA